MKEFIALGSTRDDWGPAQVLVRMILRDELSDEQIKKLAQSGKKKRK